MGMEILLVKKGRLSYVGIIPYVQRLGDPRFGKVVYYYFLYPVNAKVCYTKV